MNKFLTNTHKHLNIISSVGLGFILVLAGNGFYHFLSEKNFSHTGFIIAILALLISGTIGWLLAKHLSVCTHKENLDPADSVFILLLVLGGLIHTALDGLIVHEAFDHSNSEGIIVLSSILFHEIIRTIIFFKVIKIFGFGNIISAIAVFGISAVGIISGFAGSSLLEGLHSQEALIELITGSIFFIVAVDLSYFIKHHNKKTSWWWLAIGALFSVVLSTFLGHGHEE